MKQRKQQIRRQRKSSRITKRRTRYQTRIFLSFVYIAVPIFITVMLISMAFLQKSYHLTLRERQTSELQKINKQMSVVLEETRTVSQEIYYNSSIQSLLKQELSGKRYLANDKVAYYINNFAANRDFVDSVVVAGMDHTVYSTERAFSNLSYYRNIEKKWWYRDLLSGLQPYYWFPLADRNAEKTPVLANGTPQSGNQLAFARPIYSMSDYDTQLGYVIIYISKEYLKNIWDTSTWGKTANIMVYDAGRQMVAGNSAGRDYSEILKESAVRPGTTEIVRKKNVRYLVSCQNLDTGGWKIYMVTPMSEVDNYAGLLPLELTLLTAGIVFLLLFVSRFNARAMARPINDLSDLMDHYRESAENDVGAQLTLVQTAGSLSEEALHSYENREDEVGNIYRSYEQLIDRLNVLIRENYVKDLEKKDAELALLQSQINPHFLYNTLDSINWMALANGEDEISRMVTALSDTFRLSLIRNNSSFISLEQEFQYISSYLVLQKFRYGKRLDYEILVPDPMPRLFLPRFILQPIVENSLKHGIDLQEDGGRIEVKLDIGADVVITVTNDGSEIDLAKMERLLAFHPKKNEILVFQKEGYGVQNINRRIKILCGERYGLSYEKTENRTICRVRLPKKTKEGE
ncbi:MAG: cache domain-containing sensor histidine kinase [Eubacterium sp.]|jgi:two-component system sensor histidine kinase YesM